MLKSVVETSTNLNAIDRAFEATPLFTTIQGRKLINVQVLLDAGAAVTFVMERNGNRQGLLHVAVQDGVPEVLKLLLDAELISTFK